MAGYVLDTSAIMAFLFGEEGADTVRDILEGSHDVSIPFISLMEVEYRLARHQAGLVDFSLAAIDAWPVEVPESDYRWRRQAAHVKTQGRLSVADAWVASLALIKDAELVHKDPEFDSVQGLQTLRLPYNQKRETSS